MNPNEHDANTTLIREAGLEGKEVSETPRTDALEMVMIMTSKETDELIRIWGMDDIDRALQNMELERRRLERELRAAEAKLAEYKEDAERYRWMADNHTEGLRLFNLWQMDDLGSEQLDAAIDAARRKERL